ncbi:protein FAM171B-like [Melanotaenia boesemani]|uniref:protein FAM171B-like n=1 Tax=Melanotaenia boesemani TaxID=1250792 RepID=UPI001C0511FD|nr:protein FAM171B-like [Melanotaenia boesemani]
MRLFGGCLLLALVSCRNGEKTGELNPAAGHVLHNDDRNFSKLDHMKQEPFQQRQQALPDSTFNLRVQVNDMLSHQELSQAVVEVFVNYTKNNTALSGVDGSTLLHVPYHSGLPITVVANKAGYIPALLPCQTNRIPIFSSATVSMLSLTQGSIWLFEDSVLITGKTADTSSQPIVRFPKSLLNLTDSGNLTSVKAYVTIPDLTSEQGGSLNTQGIIISKSEHVSVELSPLAAVSVQLFSGDMELNIGGHVQISLRVPDSRGLQTSDVVPAWFFNRTVGGWMRKGLGKVMSVDGKLMWTFTAPHLGYWIAAPLSSTRGFFDLAVPVDFIFHHFFLLMVLFGGTLVTIICLLFGLLYYCRREPSDSKATKIQPVIRKDQTTSTCDDDVCEASSGDVCDPQDGQNQVEQGDNQRNASFMSKHNSNIIVSPTAVAIAVECNELELNADLSDLTFSHKSSEQVRLPASLTDNFFFYNQPVAILPAPAFFQLEEHLEQAQWSKSATLPRVGASNGAATEPKGTFPTQSQVAETEDQHEVVESSQDAGSANTSRVPFSLPESLSVPGTLNKIREGRHSVNTLVGLSKIPSPQPSRAWFVSLEGKPAAEIRYSVSEQQRRRRPIESRETSLDSGVDMSELNQNSGRRAVTLERNATFVKSKQTPKQ